MMMQVRGMIAYLPELWECLIANTWPEKFLQVTMGLSKEQIAALPQIAKVWLILYFSMALVSLLLHFGKKQHSFSSVRRKLTDMVLTILTPLLLRIMVVIFRVGQELASEIEGGFSFSAAGVDWLGAEVSTWFYPIGLCLILLIIVLIPAFTVKKYLVEYKLAGLPWVIYDVGFGFLCLSASVLSMSTGNLNWYWSIGAAAVLVLLGQTGGAFVD